MISVNNKNCCSDIPKNKYSTALEDIRKNINFIYILTTSTVLKNRLEFNVFIFYIFYIFTESFYTINYPMLYFLVE